MPKKRPSVKNEKQYKALKDKGMSKQRAAKIANSPDAILARRREVGFRGRPVPGRHDGAEEGRRSQGRQGPSRQVEVHVLIGTTRLGAIISGRG